MHKGFYASGFLYNPDSEQILLQQQTSSVDSSWMLFEKPCDSSSAENVFTKTLCHMLHIEVDTVYPVYSYTDEELGKNQCVFYAIYHSKKSLPPQKNLIFQWFSFKEITKLHLSYQIRHDIVVGQRVIDAAGRKERGEHTFQ